MGGYAKYCRCHNAQCKLPSHLLSEPFEAATAMHKHLLHFAVTALNGSNGKWDGQLTLCAAAHALCTVSAPLSQHC